MSLRRTYWHLEGLGQRPSDYDIATSRLLHYPNRGFEVQTPLSGWYAQHQAGSRLRCRDPEEFRDPRATTYASYVALQSEQEAVVDDLLGSIETSGYDRGLSSRWIATVDGILSPLRYPLHGLQMLACYVGHMAPGGRIVVTCALQAADEIRRIHRIAYRLRQLREVDGNVALKAQSLWQASPAWQPLRKLVERLLVTYDWGEALVALNLVVKPALDELVMVQFGKLALAAGDDRLEKILGALHQDCRWHQTWAEALVATLVSQEAGNGKVVSEWMERWRAPTAAAVSALQRSLAKAEMQDSER